MEADDVNDKKRLSGITDAKLDGDAIRFGTKASEAIIKGEHRGVSKSPDSDRTKSSNAARVKDVNAAMEKSNSSASTLRRI